MDISDLLHGSAIQRASETQTTQKNVMATVRAIATTPLFQTLPVSVPYQMWAWYRNQSKNAIKLIFCPERIIISRLRSVHIGREYGKEERWVEKRSRLRCSTLYAMYLASGRAVLRVCPRLESLVPGLDLLHYIFFECTSASGCRPAVSIMCGVGVAVDLQFSI